MLRFDRIIDDADAVYGSVTLSFEQRTRARLKVELDNGEPAGLFPPRGGVLRQGQQLAHPHREIEGIGRQPQALQAFREQHQQMRGIAIQAHQLQSEPRRGDMPMGDLDLDGPGTGGPPAQKAAQLVQQQPGRLQQHRVVPGSPGKFHPTLKDPRG